MIQVDGKRSENPCTSCRAHHGPWDKCMLLDDFLGFQCCANCHWRSQEDRCKSTSNTPPLKRKEKKKNISPAYPGRPAQLSPIPLQDLTPVERRQARVQARRQEMEVLDRLETESEWLTKGTPELSPLAKASQLQFGRLVVLLRTRALDQRRRHSTRRTYNFQHD
ncbi:hypothetical protein NUU61_002609 [Penicillium alfredii]|uniref:Uncharacterized protein n=1 Tax=Penicillium alfredii TaxID=1506179 RepID=A0A9W9FSR9_9EURO|nr:uncharacterized protein NUU61_002609 [Penicillium alfredii]KAJ5105262.1 hypothetical protein NUU61_002609 [Penicillium alfredii]